MVQSVRPSTVRRRRVAALAVALAALIAPLGATPAQAAAPPPVVPTTLGQLTWSFTGAAPDAQRQRITYAMNTAVLHFNTVANYAGDVRVAYDPASTTARTGYQGTIVYGSTISSGLAQHELGRWLGVGTAPQFRDHVRDGAWTGAAASARLRAYDGAQARVEIDGSDFRPYGWNTQSEYFSPERQIGLIGALRADMGLSDGTATATGTYRILNRSNGRLISVNAAGTDVVQKSSSATAQQAWVLTPQAGFWTIRSARDGLALDAQGSEPYGVDVGTRAGYRPPTGTERQLWELKEADGGWFFLRSPVTRECLDVRQQGPGTVLRIWNCEGANGDQHWRLALD